MLEPQKGIFIAESAKVIERAVRAGYQPVSFLLGERWLDQMMPLFERLVVREGARPGSCVRGLHGAHGAADGL